jgi:hypothetical protein
LTSARSPTNATREHEEKTASRIPFTSSPPQAHTPGVSNLQSDCVGEHESVGLTHRHPLNIFSGWESKNVRKIVLAAAAKSQDAAAEAYAVSSAIDDDERYYSSDYEVEGESRLISMAPQSISQINEWLNGISSDSESQGHHPSRSIL